ncbi:hypothetical protein PtrSN002B_011507 [Pyrenophora tritici-repentis]|uniref:Uncharacterized protein n=2 Tax=Pyrenophora tritici-repentis TaxID=45151 RepID=A0A2W1CXV4_9PLEO|nr:uncharacterized protein PTRG_00746 [Pyrenophora tritici-repentis Pt-1C-BFP]KAA8625371.1 hypothetical protein PtrV1_01051 [Pyrenophora tritici-repentis]EDU40184.1 predicted protein [Pyrenophora tritici-repentis Pt-1C-BFP]KAF7453770.1 hypothetical protein A1F99_010280 [Pyrenophora tritici-repentis]KAF7576862.1 hypothetical protein PtrM4_011020 [Pyrenophora tritici-repentis]KAG9387528.1 hypothetical protein A1F94_000420 [Pyrenophora tritici-repentis]
MDPDILQRCENAHQCAERELSQTIIDRKLALSEIESTCSKAEKLSIHQDWADKLHAAILHYTWAANTAVVARVLKLPRELRDTVYLHLWDFDEEKDPNRDLLYWWDSFDECWFKKDDDVSKSPWLEGFGRCLRPPHFVDKAFVGEQFAKEVLIQFKDGVGRDLRPTGERNPVAECGLMDTSMEEFVKKDVFGLGLTLEELVRNLDLRISFLPDDAPSLVMTDDMKAYLSAAHDSVTALLTIPCTNRIISHNERHRLFQERARIITLSIWQEENFEDEFHIHMLKLVARAYHGLREKGFTVRVQYNSESIELRLLLEDDVWEWTEDDWRTNLSARNALTTLANPIASRQSSRLQPIVWKQIRDHLFPAPDTEVSPG